VPSPPLPPSRLSHLGSGVPESRTGRAAEIFEPIHDTRSARVRVMSLVTGLLINGVAVAGLLLTSELAAARSSAGRLAYSLIEEMWRYRLVLMLPAKSIPVRSARPPASSENPEAGKRPAQKRQRDDDRIVERLDPELAAFVRENPSIERLLRRDIVSDIDSRRPDLENLVTRSRMSVVLQIQDAGRISRMQIRESSGITSVDRLFLELAGLLGKYRILSLMPGLSEVVISIRVAEDVGVRFEFAAEDTESVEEIRNQVQGLLALMQVSLVPEAAALISAAQITVQDSRIFLDKTVDKRAIMDFLLQYYPHK